VKIEKPRGTRDFLPDDIEKRREIERIMRKIAESYGYREVLTPTFEHLDLFTIKSGESIIEEIYAFKDKSGRDLALRPELTAPVMRLYVNECMGIPKPIRFYYFANCFRYERPQKGRYREFWQFGVELIGSSSYLADVEVIELAYRIMDELKLSFEMHVGHVGLLRHVLRDLSEDRANKIMRLIDKRDLDALDRYLDGDLRDKIHSLVDMVGKSDVLEDAKKIIPNFNFDHLERVCRALDDLEVDYKVNLGIARGLEYYTGVVFEAYAEGLGAQNQICGGGSYRLSHLFGGDDVPATGFALGFDRIAEICDLDSKKPVRVVVVSFRGLEVEALKIADAIRSKAVVVTDVMERSVKKQLSYANDISADYAVIVGEKELKEGKIAVKDLKTKEQRITSLEEFLETLG